MQQYFIDDELEIDQHYDMPVELRHHFINVLRMKTNKEFYLVDSLKHKYLCKLSNQQKAVVGSEVIHQSELPIKVTIIQGLIKPDKFDYFLMKASELGVTTIVPLITTRCVVKVNDKVMSKIERWNRICFEASCQSKRNAYPLVEKPITIKEISNFKSDVNLIAFEDLAYPSTKLRECVKNGKDITVVIGPEGGFEQSEVNAIVEQGFTTLNLGPRILRAETASLYILSVVSGMME